MRCSHDLSKPAAFIWIREAEFRSSDTYLLLGQSTLLKYLKTSDSKPFDCAQQEFRYAQNMEIDNKFGNNYKHDSYKAHCSVFQVI